MVGEKMSYREFVIETSIDEDPLDPREDEPVSMIFGETRRMQFSDAEVARNISTKDCADWAAVHAKIKEIYKPCVCYDLYALIHSGVWLSMGSFNDPWDSGQVGFIFTTKERIKNLLGWTKLTKQRISELEKIFKKELDNYTAYINGSVYYITAQSTYDPNVILSIGSVFDLKEGIEDIKNEIDNYYEDHPMLPNLPSEIYNMGLKSID